MVLFRVHLRLLYIRIEILAKDIDPTIAKFYSVGQNTALSLLYYSISIVMNYENLLYHMSEYSQCVSNLLSVCCFV